MEKHASSANVETSPFLQKHSAAIRIWHWLTFLVVISLIVTVLMASTALDPRQNIPVVQNVLKDKGVVITSEQAWAVSHTYDDKMWDLHKLLGFGLSFLFLSRIVIELTQPKEERMKSRFEKALQSHQKPGGDKKELTHYLIVKISYSFFYLLILLMATTGLIIAFGSELGLSGPVRHSIKEVHGFFSYLVYAFVVCHLVGVIVADIGKSNGIISGMINGGKK